MKIREKIFAVNAENLAALEACIFKIETMGSHTEFEIEDKLNEIVYNYARLLVKSGFERINKSDYVKLKIFDTDAAVSLGEVLSKKSTRR